MRRIQITDQTAERLAELERRLPFTRQQILGLAILRMYDDHRLRRTKLGLTKNRAMFARLGPLLNLDGMGRVEREVLEDEILIGDASGQLRRMGFTTEAISRVLSIIEEFQPEGATTDDA